MSAATTCLDMPFSRQITRSNLFLSLIIYSLLINTYVHKKYVCRTFGRLLDILMMCIVSGFDYTICYSYMLRLCSVLFFFCLFVFVCVCFFSYFIVVFICFANRYEIFYFLGLCFLLSHTLSIPHTYLVSLSLYCIYIYIYLG